LPPRPLGLTIHAKSGHPGKSQSEEKHEDLALASGGAHNGSRNVGFERKRAS
jgi:hypothetical protein